MFTGKIIVNSQASNTIYNDTTNSMATKDSTTHFAPELHIPNGTHNIDFFFSSRRRHTRCGRDWSSDVCSSDLFGGVNIFPKPMGLRATGDSKLAYKVAKAVAKQSLAVGFNWIHSPVLDINTDPRNPEIYTRAYSDRVEEVVEYAEQTCRGFRETGMIATGKHFLGRGDSSVDAHYQMPVIRVNKKTMLNRELLPYRVLIEKDLLPSIMIAHSVFPAWDDKEAATVSKTILTGLLREEMGFTGVITTDSMTMGAVAGRYGGVVNACALALAAGADLVLMKAENHLVEDTFRTIKRFVQEGKIQETDLDKKVHKVLKVKHDYGLFETGGIKKENPEEVMNNGEIKELSKVVAEKSVLIVRNSKGLLPLDPGEKILLIEQINKTPNNMSWHPGILYKNCLQYNKNTVYLETAYTWDEEDKYNIGKQIKQYDTIIITNFYMRGKSANTGMLAKICKNKNKKIIVVTNTPYELSIPTAAETVVVTFATSPDNMEITAGTIFGKITPGGKWPLREYPKNLL